MARTNGKSTAKKAATSKTMTAPKSSFITKFDGDEIKTDSKIVFAFANRDNLVTVGVKEFKGNKTLDFRTFWRPEDQNQWIPTKKGVSFTQEQFAAAMEALDYKKVDKLLTSKE